VSTFFFDNNSASKQGHTSSMMLIQDAHPH